MVFAGGCTLEAAEEVVCADLDILQSLVEKSLLRFSNQRYWLLETMREYASERLEQADEAESLKRRHGEWFVSLAADAEPKLHAAEQVDWLDRLDLERGNLRAVLAWASVAPTGPFRSASADC